MRGQLSDHAAPAPGEPILDELDGLRGGVPPAMARAEVIALFDDMAPRFDALLVDELLYQVPAHVGAAIARAAPGRRFAAALDLGCGTGLMGRELRPIADTVAGVDLSPRRLERAAARGVYDRLDDADVVEHLTATPVRHDLIVATDLLIYLGDLAPLFEAVRAALAGGGLFAASVERHAGVDVHRAPTGRYQHSRGYLERLAAAHDFAVRGFDGCEVRLEAGAFIPGWIFVLQAGRDGVGRARSRRR